LKANRFHEVGAKGLGTGICAHLLSQTGALNEFALYKERNLIVVNE
jgi:hypothetical protein